MSSVRVLSLNPFLQFKRVGSGFDSILYLRLPSAVQVRGEIDTTCFVSNIVVVTHELLRWKSSFSSPPPPTLWRGKNWGYAALEPPPFQALSPLAPTHIFLSELNFLFELNHKGCRILDSGGYYPIYPDRLKNHRRCIRNRIFPIVLPCIRGQTKLTRSQFFGDSRRVGALDVND